MLFRRLSEGRAITFVFLLLFSLFFRLYLLGETTIYPDEISWMVRGKEAIYALKQFNLEFFRYSWWNSNIGNEAIGWPISLLSASSLILLGSGQSGVSFNLLQDYIAGRLPVAITSAIFIPLFYLFSSYIFSRKIALLAAALLLLDSTHIGLSRWIIHDAFLATCTFIAVISFTIAVKQQEKYWLVIAGLFLSLGFLTKPNGLLPVVSWLVAMLYLPRIKERFVYLSWAGLSFILFTIILWPSSWINPVFSIFEYLWRQTQLTQIGVNYYFMGTVSNSPPDWFYLFQIWAKLPTLVIFCFLVFLVRLLKNFNLASIRLKESLIFLSFLVFCISFLVSISLPNIKLGARYALPLWPWIYLAVASVITSTFTSKMYRFVVLILILLSLSSAIKYFPENYLFYNSLVGGPKGAQKLDLVSLCYGSRQALDFTKKCKPEVNSVAILGCSNVTAPYYFHGKITTDWQKEKIVIVDNSYAKLLPNVESVEFFKLQTPEKIITLKEAEIARLYKNDPNIRCQD